MKRRKTIPRSVLSTALIISTLHKVQLLTGKNLFLSLALSLAIAAGNEQPVWAQLNANASFDLGHDISQVLTSMTGSGTQPLCTQNSAQLGTTLLLDQNLCGFSAPGGPLPNISASDTSGAVGPTHYIQTVNFSVTIYSKSGTVVYGPFPTTAFWTNFTPI